MLKYNIFNIDENNIISINNNLINKIQELDTNYIILPNNEIIYNKLVFIDFIFLYKIKYIKLEKNFLKLISEENSYKYAYAPSILKNVLN